MAGEYSGGRRNSNTQLLEELETLSQTLYQQPQTASSRRTASLALPRNSVPAVIAAADDVSTGRMVETPVSRPRSRRMSLSPWRSRPKLEDEKDEKITKLPSDQNKSTNKFEVEDKEERKGIWNWKPIRALSHMSKQKLSCLFSVEVVTAQNLPSSMNGLRLSVSVRKKETKDGAVHTMPSRVSQGSADFEETLFIKCHIYYAPGNGKQTKFEPRPFWIYLYAVDAQELDFGRHSVDLSQLVQESMEKSYEGARVRQWDMCFDLSGKAKGGELVLKLGFQIMEKDGGIAIYNNQGNQGSKSSKPRNLSASFARKQSKTSFSVPSPKMTSRSETWTPAGPAETASDIQGIEHLDLDEPEEPVQKKEELEQKIDDDLPDFEVVDKGVEIQDKEEIFEGNQSDGTVGERSASSETMIKEMVNDPLHVMRLSELDSIAQQIKALESMMSEEKGIKSYGEETDSQRLDEEEETVTKEFLQLLEDEETEKFRFYQHKTDISHLHLNEADESVDADSESYLPDLGKGIGCVVQTRDGGYLVSMNPFDNVVSKKETPKLAMQISKPMVLLSVKSLTGFELFHRMAALGLEELSSQIISLMPLDELMGKTSEQVAFEGIASAIIQGRNKERANTSAARTIASVKTMANAMSSGRKERILTGIWNLEEEPLTAEEILAISLQKIEDMAIEALKIQADITGEDAPFDVSSLNTAKDLENPLASAIPLEEWVKNHTLDSPGDDQPADTSAMTIAVTIQMRDPIRRYEAVGGPVLAMIHAAGADVIDGEKRFKVMSLHVGGMNVEKEGKRSMMDAKRQRLTATQWLVAHGMGKAAKKGKQGIRKGQDIMWSISSRVMADMWLKSIRNPDVRFST